MSKETLSVLEQGQLENPWEQAVGRVEEVTSRLHPELKGDELSAYVEGVKDYFRFLADSDELRFDLNGGVRTVMPVDEGIETPGFGLPAAEFTRIMNIGIPSQFDFGNPEDEGFLPALAKATGKRVSAMIDGKYIKPAQPPIE